MQGKGERLFYAAVEENQGKASTSRKREETETGESSGSKHTWLWIGRMSGEKLHSSISETGKATKHDRTFSN